MISPLKLAKLELHHRRLEARKARHTLQQLFWECTLRCNLNCRHCGSDCRTDAAVPDMPPDDFMAVLDEVAEVADPAHTLIITTGGEPLVRPDIVECGRRITGRGFMWGMVSNGMLLTPRKLDQLIEAGLRTIAVSIDGFEDDHNWMRGNRLSFARVMDAVRALTRSPLTWDVITCVNQRNFGSLERFRDFLIGAGVRRWRIFTVFPNGRAKEDDMMHLGPADYRRLLDFIARERKRGVIDLSYSCEGFLANYEHRVRDHQYFCQAGINVASVLADGSISGCLSIRSAYHQGNIATHRFSEVWTNGFQPYRNRLWMKTGRCANCRFWRYCEGNAMHLRETDGSLSMCNLERLS